MVHTTPTSTLENLARLAAKPGVQSTLVLSKSDGSIIRSTGLLASSAGITPAEAPVTGIGLDQGSGYSSIPSLDHGEGLGEQSEGKDTWKSAEHIAGMVFAFLAAANGFAGGMETGDDAKLLRMRTRKNEIVIVPG
ncbi:MAG: hypothetical protein LQ338_002830 [Usnochroma carphineum]|nr:MAG: hypothetical protein LQ338_002830 [Usnochroma carphineum]